MVDNWVLMTLINGLYDGDTQQAVLSKVEELNLEDTIVFVEAREVGQQSAKVLSGGYLVVKSTGCTTTTVNASFVAELATARIPNMTSGRQTAQPSTRYARNATGGGTSLINV